MSDPMKFVAVTDKATNRTFHVLLTAKQEEELVAPPAPSPAPVSTPAPAPALPGPYAGNSGSTC